MYIVKNQAGILGMRSHLALLGLLWMVFSSCSSNILSRSSTSNYQEDLAKVRPHYPFKNEDLMVKSSAQPEEKAAASAPEKKETSGKTVAVTSELADILQTINQQNKSVKFMPGFRIQLYVGNIRSEADAAKAFVYRAFPDLNPYITFSQPTYRVKIGDFMSKAAAEHVLSTVRLQYTSAVVISDKIEIEKALLQSMAE